MDLSNYANYHVWAGEKIRAILETVTDEEYIKELGKFFSYPTLRKHIEHILLAEEFCISFMDKSNRIHSIQTWKKFFICPMSSSFKNGHK